MTHYHFIGIGGTGLSPIAQVLLEQGHQISGSDMLLSPLADELQKLGVKVHIGHAAEHVIGADLVIRSSAIPDDNVEVIAALNAGISVLKRVDFLGELTKGKTVIAIAGTHGKTTTTAMLAWVLTSLDLDPSFIIGGVSKNLKSNAHSGKGKYFVIEADEYDKMFLGLQPDILLVTNIEHDHPDLYPTPQIYFETFVKLLSRIKNNGKLLICKNNQNAYRLNNYLPKGIIAKTYGLNHDSDFFATNIQFKKNGTVCFDANINHGNGIETSEAIKLQVPGEHNVINALGVLGAAHLSGISLTDCCAPLESFIGTGRRFDIIGTVDGITIINDYAHHPTEINTTLSAARQRFPDKSLWVVWQPHTYSRTRTLLNGFTKAFRDSDHLIVTEIYRSREKLQDYSSSEVVSKIQHPDVRFIPDFATIIDYLDSSLKSGDVLLVLSAGDADQISTQVLQDLSIRRE